jgi:hypothetical protein
MDLSATNSLEAKQFYTASAGAPAPGSSTAVQWTGATQGTLGERLGGDVVSMRDIPSPDFSRYSKSPAAAVATARMSATQVKESEVRRLQAEHRRLALEEVMKRLSPEQEARLRYIRWNLDRIEDARSGAGLDILHAEVMLYRQLANDLQSLKRSIDEANVRRK